MVVVKHPLIVSLANTNEVLFVKNRSGNRPSHEDAHIYVDKCIELLRGAGFKKIRFRGDTDFSQTEYLDGWDDQNVLFVFGIDAMPNLINIAESLENAEWKQLVRPPKYEVKTQPLGKRENVKERIVIERGYKNLHLEYEEVAEVEYSPTKCEKSYRLVMCRKTISVKKGQQLLMPETRYFFYLTNDRELSAAEIVFESNARCNQENLIGNLKSMNALRMPLDNLNSNWLYLVAGRRNAHRHSQFKTSSPQITKDQIMPTKKAKSKSRSARISAKRRITNASIEEQIAFLESQIALLKDQCRLQTSGVRRKGSNATRNTHRIPTLKSEVRSLKPCRTGTTPRRSFKPGLKNSRSCLKILPSFFRNLKRPSSTRRIEGG